MRLTEVRCYVLAVLAADGKLTIERNGALEPSIKGYCLVGDDVHPFSEKRLLTAVRDLHAENYIRFRERGLHGVYKGQAELTDIGQLNLPVARSRLDEFAELRKRRVGQQEELLRGHDTEVAELGIAEIEAEPASTDQVRARQGEAIQRVAAFLGQFVKTANAHPEDIYILQTLDREKDELVSLPLRVSDLTMLVNAALDAR